MLWVKQAALTMLSMAGSATGMLLLCLLLSRRSRVERSWAVSGCSQTTSDTYCCRLLMRLFSKSSPKRSYLLGYEGIDSRWADQNVLSTVSSPPLWLVVCYHVWLQPYGIFYFGPDDERLGDQNIFPPASSRREDVTSSTLGMFQSWIMVWVIRPTREWERAYPNYFTLFTDCTCTGFCLLLLKPFYITLFITFYFR